MCSPRRGLCVSERSKVPFWNCYSMWCLQIQVFKSIVGLPMTSFFLKCSQMTNYKPQWAVHSWFEYGLPYTLGHLLLQNNLYMLGGIILPPSLYLRKQSQRGSNLPWEATQFVGAEPRLKSGLLSFWAALGFLTFQHCYHVCWIMCWGISPRIGTPILFRTIIPCWAYWTQWVQVLWVSFSPAPEGSLLPP